MLSPHEFCDSCAKQGISFFAGVPDSLLQDFCAYLMNYLPPQSHVIAANEGGAVGLATGHYLATGNPALVYMQNSGQGNAVNPLLSLADPEVYGIPMLLLVGWRGEPGVHDEPQHVKQGRVMNALFDAMEIPYEILVAEHDAAAAQVARMLALSRQGNRPVALIVRKGTFAKYAMQKASENTYSLLREEVIGQIAASIPPQAVMVGTTGHISRELYEYRARQGDGHARDFLTVGSMGHASQVALGIALAQPERTVYCLDGDGAMLMHLGAMTLIGQSRCSNIRHVVLNNGAHGSVGGQPTVAFSISFLNIARGCGYTFVQSVNTLEGLNNALTLMKEVSGPAFLEVKVSAKVRQDLGRPATTPAENRDALMKFLGLDVHPMTSNEYVQVGAEGTEVFIQKFFALGRPDDSVFMIAGRQSYEASGAARFFPPLLADKRVVRFSDFSANPKIDELRRALVAFKESRAGLILSVGGGSAIDIGKLVNYFAARGVDTEAYLEGKRGEDAVFFPHLAVPTTAGSGSESTHFAVLYDGFKKISVANKRLIPSHVWLNPAFTASMSPYQTASSGFDALAQAIESYWAVGSTLESRQDSAKALRLCLRHLEGAVLTPTSEHRAGMLEAAHLAGHAINVSKTTAAHAMSYALTAHYGLTHGHAVAMTLPAVFEANAAATEADVNDLRGVAHVRAVMHEICMPLGVDSPKKAAQRIREIMARIGLSDAWFSAHGFDPAEARDYVMQEVNAERLANNPRRLDGEIIARILSNIR